MELLDSRKSQIARVARVTAGNCLEVYDLIIFGYYASEIGRTFFPSNSGYASLMFSLATFGAGYLMRPIGAVVLGAYIDTAGRRAGLILTLFLMSIGTLSIALMPGYKTVGIIAPIVVVLGRLLQGFSAGAEQGGVSVYLSEIAPRTSVGLYVSWQSASTQISVVLAAVLGMTVTYALPPAAALTWGWRIPFLVGCLLLPLLFFLRRSLAETSDFVARERPRLRRVLSTLLANWATVLLAAMLATMTTVSFYILTTYTPTFGKVVLHLSGMKSLMVTLTVGLANFCWLPLGGALSDRIGRTPVLIACTVGAIASAYPAMHWLVSEPSFERLLCVCLWLSLLYGFFNGAMIVFLTEIMPVEIRTIGFSLAYSMATAVGGFSPVIITWLIHKNGNRAMPGACISIAALLALVGTLSLVRRRSRLPLHHEVAP